MSLGAPLLINIMLQTLPDYSEILTLSLPDQSKPPKNPVPDDFICLGRASRRERVNWAYLSFPCLTGPN